MGAYVVVHVAAGERGEELLAAPAVKKLLTDHRARLLAAPVPHPAGMAAPAPLTLAVPDMATADRLAAALRSRAGVDTAYAKPGEELP
jgi:hypothetical protein